MFILRRMMFSLLLATSITSVQASDIEDKVINGFRFHRTPETGVIIYDQIQKNIGSIFPENKLTLLDPFSNEDILIPALLSVLKEFPEIQAVDIVSDSNNITDSTYYATASYRLLEALLTHNITRISVSRLRCLKENDVTSLPDNNSLQKLYIELCFGEEALIATQFTSLLSKLKALKQLSIPEKIAANIDSSAFKTLANLEEFTLRANTLKVRFQDFVQLPSLTKLNVYNCNNKYNIRSLAEELKKRTTPLFLGLNSHYFDKQHFKSLFENQQYSQITGLKLIMRGEKSSKSLSYLNSAFADNTLHILAIEMPALKNGGVDIVAKGPHLTSSTSLTRLSLQESTLDNQDVQTLISTIATHPALEVLKMNANITNVQRLFEEGNTTLTVLSTPKVIFNNSNVDQLCKLPNLTALDFGYSAQPGENPLETFNSIRKQLTSLERVYINGVVRKSEETLFDILNKSDVTKGKSIHPFDKYF